MSNNKDARIALGTEVREALAVVRDGEATLVDVLAKFTVDTVSYFRAVKLPKDTDVAKARFVSDVLLAYGWTEAEVTGKGTKNGKRTMHGRERARLTAAIREGARLYVSGANIKAAATAESAQKVADAAVNGVRKARADKGTGRPNGGTTKEKGGSAESAPAESAPERITASSIARDVMRAAAALRTVELSDDERAEVAAALKVIADVWRSRK